MAKRKKPRLPTLTMLSVSKSELLRFHLAMEALQGVVHDLQVEVAELKQARKRSQAAKKANETRKGARAAGSESGGPSANPELGPSPEEISRGSGWGVLGDN